MMYGELPVLLRGLCGLFVRKLHSTQGRCGLVGSILNRSLAELVYEDFGEKCMA